MYFDYKKEDQEILQTSGQGKPDNQGPEITRSGGGPTRKKSSKKTPKLKLKFASSHRRR